jgi:NAD(P)-dependent dehydrogenase (short-subunit alcohol dehydrogenase family)
VGNTLVMGMGNTLVKTLGNYLVTYMGNTLDIYKYTNDGFEMTFGVNHLGHFLLANLMLKQMVNNGRIVFVSSDTHEPPKFFPYTAPVFSNAKVLAYPDINGEVKSGTIMLRYPTSKLCNILCAYEMAARIASETDKNITVNAFNPGLMTDTNFTSSGNKVTRAILVGIMKVLAAIIGRLGSSKKSGKELAALITDSQYNNSTGKYFDRGKEVKSSAPSYDKTAARNLWIESAELVKLRQDETILSII